MVEFLELVDCCDCKMRSLVLGLENQKECGGSQSNGMELEMKFGLKTRVVDSLLALLVITWPYRYINVFRTCGQNKVRVEPRLIRISLCQSIPGSLFLSFKTSRIEFINFLCESMRGNSCLISEH